MQFDFKIRTGKDSLGISGQCPLVIGSTFLGMPVELYAGRFHRTFVLNEKGVSTDKAVKIAAKLKNQIVAAAEAKFSLSIKKETLFPILSELGFSEESAPNTLPVALPIVILINGRGFPAVKEFRYSAKKGVRGVGKS